MSIDRNVGGMSRHLAKTRSSTKYLKMKKRYRDAIKRLPGGAAFYNFSSNLKNRIKRALLPWTIFENMGLNYYGPVDGHDLPELIRLLKEARDLHNPVVVHVVTQKGHGYEPAEQNPSKFHGVGKFNPENGETCGKKGISFSDSFGETLTELAAKNNRICAITAAMPSGTGLTGFQKAYPERTFDVGIAEEHAVSMAGGLAKQGMVPVVALYSTFLQRSFDQLMQDVSMLKLHVVFAIDRAGLVGEDGETHHGIYDVGFLRQNPGMTVLCPASMAEQKEMLTWAVEKCDGPVAVRYPRGGDGTYQESAWTGMDQKVVVHRQGDDVTLITYGTMINNVLEAADLLEAQGIHPTVLRLQTVAPLDAAEIVSKMSAHRHVVTVEESATGSGVHQELAWQLQHILPDCKVDGLDLGNRFVTHGDMKTLYKFYGLDGQSIADFTREVLKGED